MNLKEYVSKLENKIKSSYEDGVTIDVAEKLAGEFLHAQLIISSHLKAAALDSKMRKAGLKAVRAAVYLAEVQKSEKKPSDVLLSAIVDSSELVSSEETSLYVAEEDRDELERHFNIFREAHIYFRGVAKGKFD